MAEQHPVKRLGSFAWRTLRAADRFVNERPSRWVRHERTDRAIVLVHGFLSNGSRAWRSRGGDWLNLMRDDPRLSGWDLIRAEWYSTLLAVESGVEVSGEALFKSLTHPRGETPSPLLAREIVFVGHSMGGLVTRAMLVQHPELLADRRVSLLTLGTPAHGVELARLLDFVIEPYGHAQAKDLQANSAALLDLHNRFGEIAPQMQGRELVEEHILSPVRKPLQWVDRLTGWRTPPLVTMASQGRYFGEPRAIRLADHASLSRPTLVDDAVHEELVVLTASGSRIGE